LRPAGSRVRQDRVVSSGEPLVQRERPAVARPLVILPTYNESENIAAIISAAGAALPHAHLLVIDDGSPDGTADLATTAGAALGDGRVTVLRRPAKSGLGSAYRDGFRWGIDRGHDALIEMDSDFQHDPAALPELLAALSAGADAVIGSRYVAGGSTPAAWPRHRLLLSRWANRYAGAMLGLGVRDATAGFRAYRADLLDRIDLDAVRADGYGFQVEMTYETRLAGGRIVEVPIRFGDRTLGTSKMSVRIVVEALVLVTVWGVRHRIRRGRVSSASS
jgi:dolichol-phosphate mannosyltransferase